MIITCMLLLCVSDSESEGHVSSKESSPRKSRGKSKPPEGGNKGQLPQEDTGDISADSRSEITVPGDGRENQVLQDGSDGKLPEDGSDGKLPEDRSDGKLPEDRSDGKLPEDGSLPEDGTDGKLPKDGSDGKLSEDGSDGKLPVDGSDGKLPEDGGDGKLPEDGSDGKLPKDGSEGKLLCDMTENGLPVNRSEVTLAVDGSVGKVLEGRCTGESQPGGTENAIASRSSEDSTPGDMSEERSSNTTCSQASGSKASDTSVSVPLVVNSDNQPDVPNTTDTALDVLQTAHEKASDISAAVSVEKSSTSDTGSDLSGAATSSVKKGTPDTDTVTTGAVTVKDKGREGSSSSVIRECTSKTCDGATAVVKQEVTDSMNRSVGGSSATDVLSDNQSSFQDDPVAAKQDPESPDNSSGSMRRRSTRRRSTASAQSDGSGNMGKGTRPCDAPKMQPVVGSKRKLQEPEEADNKPTEADPDRKVPGIPLTAIGGRMPAVKLSRLEICQTMETKQSKRLRSKVNDDISTTPPKRKADTGKLRNTALC